MVPDRVVVAAPVSLARDVAGGDEVTHDAVCGALGDPDGVADVAQADVGVFGQADQDLCVVGQKRP